jgi:hypothetical protein
MSPIRRPHLKAVDAALRASIEADVQHCRELLTCLRIRARKKGMPSSGSRRTPPGAARIARAPERAARRAHQPRVGLPWLGCYGHHVTATPPADSLERAAPVGSSRKSPSDTNRCSASGANSAGACSCRLARIVQSHGSFARRSVRVGDARNADLGRPRPTGAAPVGRHHSFVRRAGAALAKKASATD